MKHIQGAGRWYLDGCAKKRVLHILRNPHGFTEEQVRQARCDAADMIEMIDGRYEDRAHPGCGDSECVKQNRCLRAFEPRCPSCGNLRNHQPCNEDGAITGCFDGFHFQPEPGTDCDFPRCVCPDGLECKRERLRVFKESL